MSLSLAGKWFRTGITAGAGFLLPIVTAPYPVDNLFQAGPLSSRLSQTVAGRVFVGGTQVGGAIAAAQFTDQVILGGASARTLEVLTFGKYQAPQSAWDDSPKSRLGRLHTHGYQVKPGDRMRRNPPMMTSRELIAYESRGG